MALSYIPRLDGLRAVSIAAVVLGHFAHIHTINGVRVFFVLSGFLITRILLDHRDQKQTTGAVARTFYWHRLLRIFPPYYAAIAVAVLLGLGNARDTWLSNILYLASIRLAIQNHSDSSEHFWSLSVEEQFYVLWFVALIVMPRRFLVPAIAATIIIAPCVRAGLYFSGYEYASWYLLPCNMDALGWGALICVIRDGHKRFSGSVIAVTAAAMLVLGALLPAGFQTDYVFKPTLFAIGAMLLIGNSASDRPCPLFIWLEWPPIRHIGRISYGIYVYHVFVAQALRPYAHVPTTLAGFVLLVAATLAVSEASWWLMERPLLKLKNLW